jgi:Zn-dependent protease/CBS domain-containing protein
MRLGRPFGVEVRASPSFLALGALVYLFAHEFLVSYLPASYHGLLAVLAVVIGAAFLASVALHEVAHAVVARLLGLPVQAVTLTLLGGMTNLGGEPASPGDQALVALAGPLVNVVLAGVGAAVALATAPHTAPPTVGTGLLLANLLLALYNLLPGLPLDGGQLVRAALWRLTGDRLRALRGTALTGVTLAVVCFVVAVPAWLFWRSSLTLLLLSVTVVLGGHGAQLVQATGNSRRLSTLAAGQLARPAYTVSPQLPLAEALRRAQEAGADAVLLGDGTGQPSAVVTAGLLAQIPPARRPWLPASAAGRPLTIGMVLPASLVGEALVAALQRTPAAEYLVVDGPRVVGVLRSADLARAGRSPRPRLARAVRRRA